MYLQHSFAYLDSKKLPGPKDKKGESKMGKRNDTGRLEGTTLQSSSWLISATESVRFQSTCML
jgi:hypothetical protein